MGLTRSEYEEIVSRGRPFCDLWCVAFFLGLTWYQVDHLYSLGRLPKAMIPDGREYRPGGDRLVPAEKLAQILPEGREMDFERWRSGAFDVTKNDEARDEVPTLIQPLAATFSLSVPVTVS